MKGANTYILWMQYMMVYHAISILKENCFLNEIGRKVYILNEINANHDGNGVLSSVLQQDDKRNNKYYFFFFHCHYLKGIKQGFGL